MRALCRAEAELLKGDADAMAWGSYVDPTAGRWPSEALVLVVTQMAEAAGLTQEEGSAEAT